MAQARECIVLVTGLAPKAQARECIVLATGLAPKAQARECIVLATGLAPKAQARECIVLATIGLSSGLPGSRRLFDRLLKRLQAEKYAADGVRNQGDVEGERFERDSRRIGGLRVFFKETRQERIAGSASDGIGESRENIKYRDTVVPGYRLHFHDETRP